jgi:hypothetical protein
MKQYVIDQLRESDYEKIREFLEQNAEKTVLDEIFWVTLPEGLYTVLQGEHKKCYPFYFAVNLSRNHVAFELLIRSRETIRCNCIAYATSKQRDHIIGFADDMLRKLEIMV